MAAANGLGCHADWGAAGTPAGGTSQVLSVRQKMKEYAKSLSTIGALIAPTAIGALTTELYYVFQWKAEWLSFSVYVVSLLVALTFLYRSFSWPWWGKLLAAIPFVALSLVATVYVCLMVAAAHGDAL